MDCLFCKLVDGKDNQLIYRDKRVVAFHDIAPQAPIHILVVPCEHIATINHMTNDHKELMGHMLYVAKEIAKAEGIAEDGYRLIFNVNRHGGQTVYHVHLHIIGGHDLTT